MGSGRGPTLASIGLERFVAAVRDVEQRIELGQLEQRLQVLVQSGEAQLTALLADLLRQADQHAQARAVDVAGVREVDEELPLPGVQTLENLLLQLLPIADDELTLDVDDG